MKKQDSSLGKKADEVIDRFVCYGQGQVFRFWEELDESQRQQLLQQAEAIDLPRVSEYIRAFLFPEHHRTNGMRDRVLGPPDYLRVPETEADQVAWEEAWEEGETALSEGQVAVLTLAGGQGTRLGLDGPKGTLGITPLRQKSLFQVLAEKIRFAEEKYGRPIHWFLMTSRQTHDATRQFFEQNDFFGIRNLHFFQQGLLPAADFQGKILLEAKDRIALQPNGSGGALRALVGSGSLAPVEASGVGIISLGHIDNPLANIIDPWFIGFHRRQRSEMSFRVIRKKYPEEPVGLFAACDGKAVFVEYVDLSPEQRLEQDGSGKPRLHVANAGIYLLNCACIRRFAQESCALPFHISRKKVPTLDPEGNRVVPTSPNGLKFEYAIPDLFGLTSRFCLLEGRREEIFSPVKNAQGLDSPQTCRQDQRRLFARWLIRAGVEIPTDDSGLPPFALEISPLFADNERDFLRRWAALPSPPAIGEGTYIA